jgi:NitT/TauT family transport system substrate-binding protein
MAAANRDFTRKHPLAIKRALRAMLKATDLCARQPERAARRMVERGVADQYEYVLQSVKEIGFQWREYESEDTVRFWALRLREAGIIKSSPSRIITQGTDWRFFNELKRETQELSMRAGCSRAPSCWRPMPPHSSVLSRRDVLS